MIDFFFKKDGWDKFLFLILGWFLKIAIVVMFIGTLFIAVAKAEPPHPRLAYKWESMPSGRVILYFRVNQRDVRYLYPLIHEVEPATPCMPKYENDQFRLVTWSDMPFYYTVSTKPVAKWDDVKKTFVGME